MQPSDLPTDFRRRIVDVFYDEGASWLRDLPDILQRFTARWQLDVEPPFDLGYGYVAPATRVDGERVVLKLRVPNHETRCEIDALRAYDGRAAVRLLDCDRDAGALLLERALPGTQLADEDEDDAEATVVAARVMAALWRPPPRGHELPTVLDWWRGAVDKLEAAFAGGTGPLPRTLVQRAAATFDAYREDGAMLLHGDVHHMNILRATREPWLVIDPHGVIGPREFEAGTFLRNRLLHRDDPTAALRTRLDILAEHSALDRASMVEWAIAHCVLSAMWSLEPTPAHDWRPAVEVAEMLMQA